MASRDSGSQSSHKATQEFISEAEEILECMREGLANFDDQRASGGEVDPDLINGLFRSAHSLKALAGMFGLDPIQDFAHRFEDILDGMRLGRVALETTTVSAVSESIAMFGRLLEAVGDPEALAAIASSVEDLTERIGAATEAPQPSSDVLESLDIDRSLLRALTEYEEHRLRANIERGRQIMLADSTFEIMSFEEGLSALSTSIREVGEVLSTLPAPGETSESQIRFSLLVASDLSCDELVSRLEDSDVSVQLVRRGQVQSADSAPGPASGQESVEPPKVSPVDSSAQGGSPPAHAVNSLRSISETVRVDIHKLDELMNLVGELAIYRSAVGEIASQLVANTETTGIGNALTKVHKALDRKLKGMQSAVLEVRMVPMRQVFDKVSRVVRTLRRELKKEVRLETSGANTELDKLIVEELVDPVMHIVRNAIDHAIEPVDERLAAGKEPEGRITIEAFQRGNHVVVRVTDDGKGIDVPTLRAHAEAAGIISSDVVLSEKEALDLIFAPGLSTRSEVTETSGRGVGMDVVRSNVIALGGILGVESTPNRGTSISMTLPITLAIIQSLIVTIGRNRFAIPMNAVLETLMVETSEIQHSESRELLNLRGEAVPLRRLAREFGLDEPADDAKQFAVIVGMGDLRVGLIVDQLEGEQDTVIKPIQGPIPMVRGIAGATELGGQEPVLVLDVSSLIEDAIRRKEAA